MFKFSNNYLWTNKQKTTSCKTTY